MAHLARKSRLQPGRGSAASLQAQVSGLSDLPVSSSFRGTLYPRQHLSRFVKFEQIPLFYPHGCAAPQRGIALIVTLERFVVYFSSELIISGRAPGRGPEGTGNCSSCYGPGLRVELGDLDLPMAWG